jgi:hypothetical protein
MHFHYELTLFLFYNYSEQRLKDRAARLEKRDAFISIL